MKKLLILSLAALFAISTTSAVASTISHYPESGYSYSVRTISVYKFGHGTLKITFSGKYDSDSNMLSVNGKEYSVSSNPYYGSSDRRGAYPYKAGEYFFDL